MARTKKAETGEPRKRRSAWDCAAVRDEAGKVTALRLSAKVVKEFDTDAIAEAVSWLHINERKITKAAVLNVLRNHPYTDSAVFYEDLPAWAAKIVERHMRELLA